MNLSRASSNGYDLSLDRLPMYHCIMGGEIDIQFASNAELPRQVNPRLDRETGVRQQPTSILRFQVINVGAITMHLFADRMAGPVHKIFPISRALNHLPADIIHFPPMRECAAANPALHERHGRIASLPHNLKNLLMPCGYHLPDKTGPCNIRIDSSLAVPAWPRGRSRPGRPAG